MPIYEYQCNTCSHEFEKLVFTRDDTQSSCPVCNSRLVTKKMSAVRLKGNRAGDCETPGTKGFS